MNIEAVIAMSDGRLLYYLLQHGTDMKGPNKRPNKELSQRSGNAFVILGIEKQSEIDYAMPFRILELDFVNYARQMQTIRDSHAAEWKDEQGHMHRPKNVSIGECYNRDNQKRIKETS